MGEIAIEVRGLRKSFGAKEAVAGIDLQNKDLILLLLAALLLGLLLTPARAVLATPWPWLGPVSYTHLTLPTTPYV